MMPTEAPNDYKYFNAIDDCKPELIPIKCWSLLQFFQLRGDTPKDITIKVKDYAKSVNEQWGNEIISMASATTLAKKKFDIPLPGMPLLSRQNLVPIPGLQYVVEAKAENRFYLRTHRGYPIDLLFFYYDGMGSTDEAVENLRRYVCDGVVTLMFTPAMVEDMKQMLKRVYKSHLAGDKTIDYKDYINLLDRTLALEDFKRVGAVTGYKTVINQFELEIKEIWKNVFEKTNK